MIVDGFLGHGQCASTHSKAYALNAKVLVVAATAVDLRVGTVTQIGRVKRFAAIGAGEAPLVPYSVFADHLLGSVHNESAPATTSFARIPHTSQRFAIRTVKEEILLIAQCNIVL